jgi:C-terminal processing protease CtpA/Prc
MRLTDARDKIRGEPNTPVVLTVRRKQSTGETATLDVTVVRKVIENHAAHFTALPGDIGSVELDQFSSLNVPGDVAAMVARTVLPLSIKALADRTDSESIALSSRFKQLLSVLEAGGQLDGASLRVAMQARDVYDEYGQGGGFILDLSHNPGGEFGVFEDVAGIFLPDGLVVSMQSRELGSDRIIVHEETLLPSAMLLSDHPLGRGIEKTTTEMKPRVPLLLPRKMPFVVLIGPTSASAAELTSGMLSAHKRAVLIGQTLRDQPELKSSSLGKGSGQVLVPLPYDYSAHVTRFEFFPGGLKSNERGVIADLDAEPGKQREAAVAEIARLNLGGAADRGAVQAARARYNKTFGGFLRERGEEDRKPVADQIPEMFH